jgi:hypothetical protein
MAGNLHVTGRRNGDAAQQGFSQTVPGPVLCLLSRARAETPRGNGRVARDDLKRRLTIAAGAGARSLPSAPFVYCARRT